MLQHTHCRLPEAGAILLHWLGKSARRAARIAVPPRAGRQSHSTMRGRERQREIDAIRARSRRCNPAVRRHESFMAGKN